MAIKIIPKTIVIIGAGFAGISAYRTLLKRTNSRSVRIIVINDSNHFLFSPLLHEVATAGIPMEDAAQGLHELIKSKNSKFICAFVSRIDNNNHRVETNIGNIEYDQLIITAGAKSSKNGNTEMQDKTYTLKTLSDALAIRRRVISDLEQLILPNTENNNIHYVIFGGGPTGVELAAEIADVFRGTSAKVTLLHNKQRLIQSLHPSLSAKALYKLVKMGVDVRLNYSDDNARPTGSCVIWTGGVVPATIQTTTPMAVHVSGRIKTDQFLRIAGSSCEWAAGDIAAVSDGYGGIVPMTAQAAVKAGKAVGENISMVLRSQSPKPFIFRKKGDLLSLGKWYAIGEIWGIRISGRFSWWVWRTIYLFNIVSWSKRIRVAVSWTLNIFMPRDIAEPKLLHR